MDNGDQLLPPILQTRFCCHRFPTS